MKTPIALLLFVGACLLTGCFRNEENPARGEANLELKPVPIYKPTSPVQVQVNRLLLVGYWYGDRMADGGTKVQWLIHRREDGTFEVTFRNHHSDGRIEQTAEYGEWGVSGPFLIALTRGWLREGVREPIGEASSYYWDVYRINSIANGELDYTAEESGNNYRVRRVDEEFGRTWLQGGGQAAR